MGKIQITEADEDRVVLCPHCEAEITEIGKKTVGHIERHIIYFCPDCKKLLNIGYNLGN